MASYNGDCFGTHTTMPNVGYSSVKVENDLVDFLSKCTMNNKHDASNNHVKSDNHTLCLASSSLDSIPPSVLQMRVLTSLVLDHNDIEVIPEELCEALPHLQKFSITGNELHTLPENISCWTQLTELHLTENALVNLPLSLCKLDHLKVLKLIGNKLKKIPDDIDRLTSLQELYLGENCLCKLPENFGLLTKLLVLEVNDNKLRSLPETFGSLQKLRLLNLNSNKLNELPTSMAELESLEELDISNNNIELFPSNLRCASLLKKLYADCNQICDIPNWFKTLKSLEELSIRDNRLQYGPFPEEFGSVCERLRKFDLGGNFMSRLCGSFGNLKSLEFIHVGSVIDELERRNFQNGNWLTQLPDNFGKLSHLREAHLDENQIIELPDSFGDLINLEILDLGQNLIQTLPASFVNLRSLCVCQLSKNKLLRLPDNFCDLTSLEDLRLDNNEIADVPDLSNLQKLKILDLFNNRLTKIPEGLASLTKLISLDLDENDLGLSIMEIPQIAFKATYAPRDPALKDNWRGRERQDLINLQAEELKSSEDKTQASKTTTLQNALEQGSALWQKHGETKKREKYVRMEQRTLPVTHPADYDSMGDTEEEREEENWDNEISQSDEGYSNSLTDNDDYALGHNPDNEIVPAVQVQEIPQEDWDKELEEMNPSPYADDDEPVTYHPVPDPMNMHRFINKDEFCPSDIHAKPVRKYVRESTYYTGQFEDAD